MPAVHVTASFHSPRVASHVCLALFCLARSSDNGTVKGFRFVLFSIKFFFSGAHPHGRAFFVCLLGCDRPHRVHVSIINCTTILSICSRSLLLLSRDSGGRDCKRNKYMLEWFFLWPPPGWFFVKYEVIIDIIGLHFVTDTKPTTRVCKKAFISLRTRTKISQLESEYALECEYVGEC